MLSHHCYHKNKRKRSEDGKEANGPMAYPVLGNLPQLSKLPHHDFHNWTKQYGHVFKIWLGDFYTLVISDPILIKEIWAKNFDNFVNRIHTPLSRIYSFNYRDLTTADEVYWRNNRSLVASHFTKLKVKSNAVPYVEKQTKLLLQTMDKYSKSGELFSMNIVLEYVYSRYIPYEESVYEGDLDKLYNDVEELFKVMGAGRISDLISWLGPLVDIENLIFGTPLDKSIEYITKIYNEHLFTLDEKNPRDIMDHMIIETKERGVDPLTIILVSTDLFLAGTDTSSGTIEYFTLFMANYPEVQQKAYEELISQFGKDPKELALLKDKDSVPYFQSVIKEVMRIKFIGPMGLPRCCTNDITINGLFIPKGTYLIQNHTTLLTSEDYWHDPKEFNPERFLEPPKKYRHEDLCIPFGVGPRNCVGIHLANEEIFSACANIIINYEIKNPNPSQKIDDSENFGLVVHPNIFGINIVKRQ
eukprot:gene6789-8424_t